MDVMDAFEQFEQGSAARALVEEVVAQAKAAAEREAMVRSLASYVRRAWQAARDHRQTSGVDDRMQKSLRQRKGEYEPDKLAEIRKTVGGSEIYMMLTSVKCRAATAWLRDLMSGTGSDKPWTILPTPVPSLPVSTQAAVQSQVQMEVGLAVAQGIYPTPQDVQVRIEQARRQLANLLQEKSRIDAATTEQRMEDSMVEGGFGKAFEQFLDDLVTFPAAIMCGPVVRKRTVLQWSADATGQPLAMPTEALVEEYERVSPFDFYPDPDATDIDDGYMIRHHRMSADVLSRLKGTPYYDDRAIDKALEEYARGGLHEWMTLDEGTGQPDTPPTDVEWSKPIDVLEYWGDVPGAALVEWGMPQDQVPDRNTSYQANVWLVGGHVIKAMLNPDPLGKKPFGKACYEQIPGSFWGNGIPDLIRDVQNVCNAAARSLVNNMGIASGPQVWVNIDRVPTNEKITQMFPWKIWQASTDPMGSTAPPMEFFQPSMHAPELMGVFERFSVLADEYSGIPRYMTGDENVSGAAKTASGLSMLMGNANKLMKHVVGNIDRMMESLLQRLHLHLIYVRRDPMVRGDVKIVARGALAVAVKDTMQLRRQELLTMTANPIDMQVLGLEGRAELWRENLRGLGVNPDRVIPPSEVIIERARQQQAAMAMQGPNGANGQPALPAPQQPQGRTDPMMGMNGGYPGDMQFNA